ncbi:CRISPR-associated endonuclease/helicase Cas3 [Methylobacter tundripaludum]|uniref:CRISPR-associated endonuclease/helicase Cas3 n=1 Tax=Methylobacter tundripaludum TaxID=173365 RepID=A0A2S6H5Q0_9GAMM|nr:type I-U CRISPR-associated helicase/endonuclease Cas3 [Methylobacter tundripaludum]PPK72815.1 CRISPR-associated endonuclease/helicase Cas3 [Methylobacter tundripaludum]
MQANDFDAFFQALHDRSPFPWQSRLAKQLCEQGRWPDALNLPTSSGKTAALDVALFHLIYEATKPSDQRFAPRRIYFVVDRRLIVDEAYERSEQVAKHLKDNMGKDGILGVAASRLLELAGTQQAEDKDKEPLQVIRLRGGMPLERTFISNPLQPAIILTTVDQLGSRLLFRGYGVSANMRPIHAALTAMDSLILLDEAHLSQPFLETLAAIDRYRAEQWCEKPIKLPNAVVQMTATPNEQQHTFSLQEDDYQHSLLNQRLVCSKPAELVEIKATEDTNILANTLAKKALDTLEIFNNLPSTGEYPVIGIVVNRVATARSIFELLRKKTDTILLTGRIRATDRDNLLVHHLPRMKSGRKPQDNSEPLFVVATQTIEVGADLDFDALLTEAASLDALRQRFGRLNRLGQRPHCRAAVFYAKANKDDPIYGEALPKTWKWLNENSTKIKGEKNKQLDFGIQALNTLLASVDLKPFNMQQAHAPVLLPAHLDALVQTSPCPSLSPDSALLLHGPNSQEEDVQLVWRADLPEEISRDNLSALNATLQAMAPAAHETLSIPLYALKAFLRHEVDADVIDLEGSADKEERGRENQKGKPVYIWKGKDGGAVADAGGIKPGNIVVLPTSYNGTDDFGWFPACTTAVTDVAEDRCQERRGKHYLRLHPNLVEDWFDSEQPDLIAEIQKRIKQWQSRLEEGEAPSCLYDEVLQLALNNEMLRLTVREAMTALLTGKRSETPYPSLDAIRGVVLTEKKNVAQTLVDDDDSTSMSREISLESHCRGVAKTARYFADGIGLTPTLSTIIEQAALFHDLGKADPRFQALLQGGSCKHERLLAKSAMNATDRRARQTAQKQAEYPQGQRHECYSVALLRQYPQLLAELHDPELAQYLAGSHHGRGRPYMPAVEDDGTEINFVFNGQNFQLIGGHGLEKLDSGWIELFWRMVRRYGYWGLAFLETIVRLADQQRSEWESKNERND